MSTISFGLCFVTGLFFKELTLVLCVKFSLADNVLFALCEPDWIERVTDRKLMSAEEICKMEALKEDDNPVVVKYYLK